MSNIQKTLHISTEDNGIDYGKKIRMQYATLIWW